MNGLKNSQEIPFSKEQIEQALGMCGLSLSVRGEALTLAQFAQLAKCIYRKFHKKDKMKF